MTHKSVLISAFLACLCFAARSSTVKADDTPDGPKRIFRDPFIENLAGDWKLVRKIRGKEIENKVKVEWVLNHQFLKMHMKDVADPPAYEAIVLIGYSHADQEYITHWCDTYGGKFSSVGHGKRSGNSIEFQFQFPDGPFFNLHVGPEVQGLEFPHGIAEQRRETNSLRRGYSEPVSY